MYDFGNKLTHNGIHYSRYIASWVNATGDTYFSVDSPFCAWLREKEELTDDEISDIREMATCGKLELECSSRLWMKEHDMTVSTKRRYVK